MSRILALMLTATILHGCAHRAPRSVEDQLTTWRTVPNNTIAAQSLAAELNRQLHADLRARKLASPQH